MAEQDPVPQNSIPPKVSPFGKPPEGAPQSSGAPRPITVRLKPIAQAAPSAVPPPPPAAAVPAPAPAEAVPPASVRSNVTARVPIPDFDAAKPGVTAQVPIPDFSATSAVKTGTDVISAAPAAAKPGVTAHVAIPEFEKPASPITPVHPAPTAHAGAPATVRLRPITPPGAHPAAHPPAPAAAPAPAPSAAAAPAAPASLQPQSPPTPGSNPLPSGPKAPSSAQVQAAKSKTSRISLDSAIGVAPMAPMGAEKNELKTIRLKRPTDLPTPAVHKTATTPIRQTSRIPDEALPTAPEAAADSAGVTQKKTLKIKRPGGAPGKDEQEASGVAGAAAETSAAGEGFPEGVQLTPIASLESEPSKAASVFTAITVVAACFAVIGLAALTWCLAAQAVSPSAGINSTASVKLGIELPWGGHSAE